jgi:hypothetical protein
MRQQQENDRHLIHTMEKGPLFSLRTHTTLKQQNADGVQVWANSRVRWPYNNKTSWSMWLCSEAFWEAFAAFAAFVQSQNVVL